MTACCAGGEFHVVQEADTSTTDEAEKYRDAPIALQLVGRRYEDEKVIEALELITQVAGLPFD